MFERYVQVSENIRMEREWWKLLKYGVGLPLPWHSAHRDRVLALDPLTGLRFLPSGRGRRPPPAAYADMLREAVARIDAFCREDSEPAAHFLLALDEYLSRDAVLTAVARDVYGRGEPRRRLIEPPFHLESHRYQTVQAADWDSGAGGPPGARSGRNRRRGRRTRCSDATSRSAWPASRSEAAFGVDRPRWTVSEDGRAACHYPTAVAGRLRGAAGGVSSTRVSQPLDALTKAPGDGFREGVWRGGKDVPVAWLGNAVLRWIRLTVDLADVAATVAALDWIGLIGGARCSNGTNRCRRTSGWSAHGGSC